MNIHSSKPDFSFTSLENIRTRLLDLSTRNALLNYRFPKGKSLLFFNISPNEVADILVSGRDLQFASVPMPSEKQLKEKGLMTAEDDEMLKLPSAEKWASLIGLEVQGELPQALSEPSKELLQTLLYPNDLENRLKTIRSQAQTAVEETGADILYLVLGFLEWSDGNTAKNRKYLSPLFTLPVGIEVERRTVPGMKTYSIMLKGDVALSNVTLCEKLKRDFGLELPLIEEIQKPESYFKQVEHIISGIFPEWKIKRKGCLALLNFSKQAMYQDLNPDNWPENTAIHNHPIISQLFSQAGVETESGSRYLEEHPIDELGEEIHTKFPLIYDADSSQHSALIDAANGKNLVIEGPPGTGKSQTITNLIAASINSGKTVLFVAEKMAALNVVKDRLDKAGLGGFCLELHSYKSNKQKILAELMHKYGLHQKKYYRISAEICNEIKRYEGLRKQLQAYVELINSKWQETGLTIHEILTGAARYRSELNLSPEEIALTDLDGYNLTFTVRTDLADKGRMLADIFGQVSAQSPNGCIGGHYWYGVQKTAFLDYEAQQFSTELKDWNQSLEQLDAFRRKWEHIFAVAPNSLLLEADFQKLHRHLQNLPALHGNEIFSMELLAHVDRLKEFIDGYQDNYFHLKKLVSFFKTETLDNPQLAIEISQLVKQLQATNGNGGATLQEYGFQQKKAIEIQTAAIELEKELSKIRTNVPLTIAHLFDNRLGSFHELAIFSNLIDRLPADLWRYRDDIFDSLDMDSILEQLVGVFRSLAPLHKKLSPIFHLSELPDAIVLQEYSEHLANAGLLSFFSSTWRNAKKAVIALSRKNKPKLNELKALLPELIEYKRKLDEADRINQNSRILTAHYRGVETPLEQIVELRNWYRAIRQEYGMGFGERVKIGETLFAIDRDLAYAIRSSFSQNLSGGIRTLSDGLSSLQKFFDKHKGLYLLEQDLVKADAPLPKLITLLASVLDGLNRYVSDGLHSIDSIADAVSILEKSANNLEVLEEQQNALSSALPEQWMFPLTYSSFNEDSVAAALHTTAATCAVLQHPDTEAVFSVSPSSETYTALYSFSEELGILVGKVLKTEKIFVESGNVHKQQWCNATDITGLIEKNLTALHNPLWLATWTQYLQAKQQLAQGGLEKIVMALENGKLEPEHLKTAIAMAVYHKLAQEIFVQNPEVDAFNSLSHNALIKQFKEYDKKLMALQRQQIAYNASLNPIPTGNSSGLVKNYSEIALIQHEHSKKTRHIAIRNLLERSSQAIQALKPCFMMSPMSVAQYLKPGRFQFDIIIMDEASQILPEDAVGVLARAKHQNSCTVIVGDPKQLPPTSFFQSLSNTDEDENENTIAVEASESILESVMNHSAFSTRRLRWHYRSRHESLIAFSNKHFYDSDLVLFPSPMQESESLGIRYTKIEGCFNDGKNIEEARVVALKAAEILQNSPTESVGMVAMNSRQRDEIEMQFDQLLQDNPKLQEIYDQKAETDPVFIKNLENVQGDERDIILISMTYGPTKVGERVYQRFGPINSSSGWRRLNVLFTRAKKQMHIFSSMGSTDILVSETSNRSIKALQAFLEYCEKGHLYQAVSTGKSPDSDFEIAVINALVKHGYPCEPQVGVNGFFIDVGVKNPDFPNQFLIGIECDGATYHSAKSVRDRDRLRHEILEGLGWEIHRIWSTDWFQNPQAALNPILSRLAELKRKHPASKSVQNKADEWKKGELFDDTADSNTSNLSETTDAFTVGEESSQSISLREKLFVLSSKIRQIHPETPDDYRLLRPAMIEVLLHERPLSRHEFLERIPSYLREKTAAAEGKYLDEVFLLFEEN